MPFQSHFLFTFLHIFTSRHPYFLDRIGRERRTQAQLSDSSDVKYDIVPLLYQSGYLSIKDYDSETKEYTLGFPNREVYEAFWTSLKNHFFRNEGGGNRFDLQLMVQDLNMGHPEEFMRRIQALFADTSSEPERRKEIHFQNMVAIVAKMLGLNVRTEVHTSAGRCDMQILTARYVYIFEFKIDKNTGEAMKQIIERGYTIPFISDNRTIYIIAASFSTETRTLSDWLINRL